jgi:hypothetical protein
MKTPPPSLLAVKTRHCCSGQCWTATSSLELLRGALCSTAPCTAAVAAMAGCCRHCPAALGFATFSESQTSMYQIWSRRRGIAECYQGRLCVLEA